MRTRNLYDPASRDPYPLSRSKVELFLQCPRCFYLDRRSGIGRIDGPPYTLNLAVDALLKREFDAYRLRGEAHPIMTMYGVDAVPFRHKDFLEWRDGKGMHVFHAPTRFDVFGIIDDLWVNEKGEILIVDYKATSTIADISIDGRDSYKRQIEFYQWLFRQHDFSVSDTGYFLFANAVKDRDLFDRQLEFTMQILPYEGKDGWVDDALRGAFDVLQEDLPPPSTESCEWCGYRREARDIEN
ncbi:MAG TPA: PD-(D/E)XK nuclease family protein [Candidatus Peribacteraceae bacterium]|nr:PD-(D/E)XK nuclease family protein [Candidatus Peribacteraceae bacterium]